MADARYIDINTMLGVSNNNDIVRDEGAIINSIINIILIPKRTRKWRPAFGSSLHDFLGRPATTSTALQIRASLLVDLNKYIPYAKIGVNDVRVISNATGTGYELIITYTSKLTNSQSSATFSVPANVIE